VKIAGGVLIVLGFLGLIYGSIAYNKKDEIAKIGDVKMEVVEKKHLTLPPFVSGAAILVGAVLLFAGGRKPTA
jgi:hypothetical protein